MNIFGNLAGYGPQEIGLFLWLPNFGHRCAHKKNAEALTRKLIDQKLVIPRKLPLNSGTALFLSAAGAEALIEQGISARSGKDYGRASDGTFFKKSKWKHHLLATGVLGHLARRGYAIISEASIRRKHDLEKYPDGIFYYDYEVEDENGQIVIERSETFWLEVESHRKTGPNMKFMVDSMVKSLKVNPLNGINQICGRTINCLAVAYPIESKDEKGNNIDHKFRVNNALKSKIRRDLPINFIGLENYGLGVSHIYETKEVLQANQ